MKLSGELDGCEVYIENTNGERFNEHQVIEFPKQVGTAKSRCFLECVEGEEFRIVMKGPTRTTWNHEWPDIVMRSSLDGRRLLGEISLWPNINSVCKELYEKKDGVMHQCNLRFGKLVVSDEPTALTNTNLLNELGAIKVKIYPGRQGALYYAPTRETSKEHGPVHEKKIKKASMDSSIVSGQSQPAPNTMSFSRFTVRDNFPISEVIFLYRTRALLQAQGVIEREGDEEDDEDDEDENESNGSRSPTGSPTPGPEIIDPPIKRERETSVVDLVGKDDDDSDDQEGQTTNKKADKKKRKIRVKKEGDTKRRRGLNPNETVTIDMTDDSETVVTVSYRM